MKIKKFFSALVVFMMLLSMLVTMVPSLVSAQSISELEPDPVGDLEDFLNSQNGEPTPTPVPVTAGTPTPTVEPVTTLPQTGTSAWTFVAMAAVFVLSSSAYVYAGRRSSSE